jgi:hypothetical protein
MTMNFAYNSHGLGRKTFLHHLSCTICAFAQTESHEMWISHLDQNVVDTVNMDVLNLSSFHVIKDSAITQGSV